MPVQSSMRFRMRFSQIACIKSYGNDVGNDNDERVLSNGTPFMQNFLLNHFSFALVAEF